MFNVINGQHEIGDTFIHVEFGALTFFVRARLSELKRAGRGEVLCPEIRVRITIHHESHVPCLFTGTFLHCIYFFLHVMPFYVNRFENELFLPRSA